MLSRLPGQSVGMSVIQLILLDTNKKAKCALLSLLALLSPQNRPLHYLSDATVPPSLPHRGGPTTALAANQGPEPPAPAGTWLFRKPRWGAECRALNGRVLELCHAVSSLPCLAGNDLANLSSGFCQDSPALCLSFLIVRWKYEEYRLRRAGEVIQ